MHDQTRKPPSDQKPQSDGNPTAPPWPRSPDGNLDRAFERLVGDRPSAEDRAMLYRVRDSLGIGPNDAIWTLLFAFQHYHSLYERFPAMIRAAAGELLVEYKTETDRVLDAAEKRLWNAGREQANAALLEVTRAGEEAAEAAKARLERAIQQAARRIALGAGLAARWPWALGGAAAVSLAVVLAAALAGAVALGFGRQQGYHLGFIEGQRAATAPSDRPPDRPPSPTGRGR